MFEQHVVSLLQKYLGNYVRGISVEALKISVWAGDVLLNNLQLKAEALNALNLPIVVKAGFLGSIRLKVPWNRLGQEPVIVLLDRIFLLAEPAQDDWLRTSEDETARLQAKFRRIDEAELAMLEAKEKKTLGADATPESKSWLQSLISTVIGNLKLSITNVHIRYEDTVSNPGHPFCTGITLASLAAVTVDERGIETFLAHGVMDKLRKLVRLDRFAIYHDSNHEPWKIDKDWAKLTPREWSEIFEPGIRKLRAEVGSTQWDAGRQYLLQPLGGTMTYVRHGKQEKREPGDPFHRVALTVEEVSLTPSEVWD